MPPKGKKKNKSDKRKRVGKESKLTKLSTWPDPSLGKVKLDFSEDTKDDKELIEKIYDLNRFAVSIEDFLSLNGDVSVYGWQHVMNFALYEKYNFLLPLLKQNLDEEYFKEMVSEETHGLKDFVYVYCTMLTLIMRKIKPQDRPYALLSEFLEWFFNKEAVSMAIAKAIKEFCSTNEAKGFIVHPKGEKPKKTSKPPAKTSLKPPAKTPSKPSEKTPSKSPAKTASKTPANTIDYSQASNLRDISKKGGTLDILGSEYKVQSTDPNGNCFFEAVLRGVYVNREKYTVENEIQRRVTKFTSGENMFSESNILELRESLAAFVNPAKELFSSEYEREKVKEKSEVSYTVGEVGKELYLTDLTEDNDVQIRNREEHAVHLKANKQYSEVPDIELISKFFDICIVIFRWNNNEGAKTWSESREKERCDKEPFTGKPIVYLVHSGTFVTNKVHYDTLIPLERTL